MATPSRSSGKGSRKCSCIKEYFTTLLPDPYCHWHGDIDAILREVTWTACERPFERPEDL